MAISAPTYPASFPAILDTKFSASVPNEDYAILRALKLLHPGERTCHVALMDSATCPTFPLSAFLHSRDVRVEILNDPRHEIVTWNARAGAGSAAGLAQLFLDPYNFGARTEKGELVPRLLSGAMKFNYEGTDFLVYKCSWHHGEHMKYALFDIVFEGNSASSESNQKESIKTAGHLLITDVFRWAGALKNEIWVFQEGAWSKDKPLWGAIRNATWDDIVLEDDFLQNLRRDTRTFFDNRQFYQDLGVVWKRGILLLGPPGNGKTESIKVLLKESGQAALYVKSFTTRHGAEHGVRLIFDHARTNAPCILVIEDLDSLLTSEVRSFFLNELDGLAQNEGILTIATTNHPERIDDAILNRPSRFDVKYNFALPTEALRKTYSKIWIHKLNALSSASVEFQKSEDELSEEIAKSTDGWSFAFLKELFVSFLLRVAHDKARGLGADASVDAALLSQVESLSSQIKANAEKEKSTETNASANPMRFMENMLPIARSCAPSHPGANF